MTDLTTIEVILRVVGGALLGAIVGIERESAGQDAGFRTHLLLALGAALFGVASVGAFDAYIGDPNTTNVQVDVTRIASYVVAGVGFIGGGTILKYAGTVRGITTAASIWAAAAIGMCAGLGFWSGAVSATVVAVIALAGLKPLSSWISKRRPGPRSLTVLVGRFSTSSVVIDTVRRQSANLITSISVDRANSTAEESATEIVFRFVDTPADSLLREVTRELEAELGDELRSISTTAA